MPGFEFTSKGKPKPETNSIIATQSRSVTKIKQDYFGSALMAIANNLETP